MKPPVTFPRGKKSEQEKHPKQLLPEIYSLELNYSQMIFLWLNY